MFGNSIVVEDIETTLQALKDAEGEANKVFYAGELSRQVAVLVSMITTQAANYLDTIRIK